MHPGSAQVASRQICVSWDVMSSLAVGVEVTYEFRNNAHTRLLQDCSDGGLNGKSLARRY